MLTNEFLRAMPRRAALLCCVLLLLIFVGTRITQAQETTTINEDRASAIELYELGYFKAAIGRLQDIVKRRDDDAEAWRYLGLAYRSDGSFLLAGGVFQKVISLRPNDGEAHALLASILVMGSDVKGAGEYARRAIELGVQNAEVHYVLGESNFEAGNPVRALEEADTALTLDPGCTDALLTKARALRLLKRDRESIDALSSFLAASPNADDSEVWREDLARWQAALQAPQKTNDELKPFVYKPDEVTTKARILSKPSPEYTEKARNVGIVGTVILQMVLSSTGEVTDVRVIQRLRGGLTTQAVRAARRIQFEPATSDGKPVSQYIRFEYNFNIH